MLSNLKLIIYDFDGVFTDNKVYLSENGSETVLCNRSDGMAVRLIKELGYNQIIISTEKNDVVLIRAKKLKIQAYNAINNKLLFIKSYLKKHNIKFDEVAFVGNDINDFEAMKACNYRLCPVDSHKSILDISDVIIPKKGGDGVIRYIHDNLISK